MNLYTLKNQNSFSSFLMNLSLIFTLLSPMVGGNANVIVVSNTIQAGIAVIQAPPALQDIHDAIRHHYFFRNSWADWESIGELIASVPQTIS